MEVLAEPFARFVPTPTQYTLDFAIPPFVFVDRIDPLNVVVSFSTQLPSSVDRRNGLTTVYRVATVSMDDHFLVIPLKLTA